MLTPLGSSFVQASPARWTRFCCLHQSSMLDFLWGVQDSLGGAKARDFSRRPHSPLIAQLHEDRSCLV